MSAGARPIGVGVIGLGFMGRTHVEAYRACAEGGLANRLIAVADSDASRLSGVAAVQGNLSAGASAPLFDPTRVRRFTRPLELLADPEVELVSICTPTPTHVDLAIAALRAGKHVLLEKPVALSAREVERLAGVASDAPTLCMPAMCMRFWPGWDLLRAAVRDRRFGAPRSAVFRRLGTRPSWSNGFYEDFAQSGGALFDLHVHDVDFVRACFGDPVAVSSAGTREHVTTLYRFAGGPAHVVAEGGWDHAAGFAFRMQFVVAFERATLDYDSSREPKLALSRDGASSAVAIDGGMGYQGEVAHLLEAVRDGRALDATVDDALAMTRVLEAELESLERRAWVELSPRARTG